MIDRTKTKNKIKKKETQILKRALYTHTHNLSSLFGLRDIDK